MKIVTTDTLSSSLLGKLYFYALPKIPHTAWCGIEQSLKANQLKPALGLYKLSKRENILHVRHPFRMPLDVLYTPEGRVISLYPLCLYVWFLG